MIGDNIVIGTSGQNADVIVNHAGSDLTLTAADYIMTNDSIRLQTQAVTLSYGPIAIIQAKVTSNWEPQIPLVQVAVTSFSRW